MGRRPCCAKVGMKTGAWMAEEDDILATYVKAHGEGKWRELPQKAGLLRCGKSCRLRWVNYLQPNINHGNFSCDEEDLIIRLHMLLGSRWSLIADRLPGRTDNQIKNYWKSKLARSRRVGAGGSRFPIAPDTGSHDTPAASGSCETGHKDAAPPRVDTETGQKDDAPPRADPDSAGSAASLVALESPLVGSHDEPACFSGDGGATGWTT